MLAKIRAIISGTSVRGRVGRLFLLMGLVPLLAMGVYLVLLQSRVLSQTADDHLANYAVLEASTVDEIMRSASADIELLAANPRLQSPAVSHEERFKQLKDAQDFYELFEDITLVDPQGVVVDSTTYSYNGNWADMSWFQEALAGSTAVSEAHLIPSPTRLVVVFTAPIYSGGKVSAVVSGQMNMDRVWAALDSAKIGDTGFLVAVDRSGNIISHPNKDLILTKFTGRIGAGSEAVAVGTEKIEGEDGFLGRAAPAGNLGWQVIALQGKGEAGALVTDSLQKIAIAALVVIVVTVMASIMLSREIARPISALIKGMQGAAAGRFQQQVATSDLKEIDALSLSFNAMAANLEESTEQLKYANSELERQYEELADVRRQATTDSLTGLRNHRSLQEALTGQMVFSQRQGCPLAVLIMDINGFKLFNDTYGHQAGDDVLRQVARVLISVCRSNDIVGRYGGDEFMALLPNTDRKEALAFANHMLDALSHEGIRTPSGSELPIALSIGLAVCPVDSTHKEELLAYADASLYEAKRGSGSRIVVADGEPTKLMTSRDTALGLLDVLVQAVDIKDSYTRVHSQQNAEFAVELGKDMGLSEGAVGALRIAALLHDIGKIGVPDEVLMKPGPLTEDECAIMRQHVILGKLIVHGVPNLQDVSDAVYSHHESWDGTGYPRHLKGLKIPLAGRIMALVDAYSAMILDRPYRKALTPEEALAELKRKAGTQFDPEMTERFVEILERDQSAAA